MRSAPLAKPPMPLLPCVLCLLASVADGKRVVFESEEFQGAGQGSLSPGLVEQLQGLLSPEKLPGFLERLHEQHRPLAEKFAPVLRSDPRAVVELVLKSMEPEQQEEAAKLVAEASDADEGHDAAELVGKLVDEVLPTLEQEMSSDEGFASEIVARMAQDGALDAGGLRRLAAALVPGDSLEVVGPLLDFTNLGGTPVIENLLQLKAGDGAKFMDGPLRTLFLLTNFLAYSTAMGADGGTTLSEEGPEGAAGFTVFDANFDEKPDLQWWIPEPWLRGLDLVCGAMRLKVRQLAMQQVILVPEAGGTPGAALYTVLLGLESTEDPSKRVNVHSVRTGIGMDHAMLGMNDLHLLMGLYEAPIRSSLGWGKYLSVADYIYKLGQGLAQWEGLMRLVQKEDHPVVQLAAQFDERRKALRAGLAEGIRNATAAASLSVDDGAIRVFTGFSLGGSISRMMAAAAQLECSACPVVALTINSPSIYELLHKMELLPPDVEQPWYKDLFSSDKLANQQDLFRGFVNYVAQHGVLWKLDTPLPGSSTCMYMHPAELAGCRGVADINDIYNAAWEAVKTCRTDHVMAEGSYDFQDCMMAELTPVLQCVLQEHVFALSGKVSLKEMMWEGGELSSLSVPALFADVVAVFSKASLAPEGGKRGLSWLRERSGQTSTVKLAQEEAEAIAEKRKEAMEKVDLELAEELAQIKRTAQEAKAEALQAWARLSPCTGCAAEWCESKDIREHRCCAAGDDGVCKNPPLNRAVCRGESDHETCGGVGRFVENKGRRCQCMEGHCWDGQGCAADPHVEKRRDLKVREKEIEESEALKAELAALRAGQRRQAFEASVVKSVSKDFFGTKEEDAKPDPSVNGHWVCS